LHNRFAGCFFVLGIELELAAPTAAGESSFVPKPREAAVPTAQASKLPTHNTAAAILTLVRNMLRNTPWLSKATCAETSPE
jgi:hypothetical protein